MKDSTDVAAAISFAFHNRNLNGSRIEVRDNEDGTTTVSDSETGFMMRAKPSQGLVDTVLSNVLPADEEKKEEIDWSARVKQAAERANPKGLHSEATERRRQRYGF